MSNDTATLRRNVKTLTRALRAMLEAHAGEHEDEMRSRHGGAGSRSCACCAAARGGWRVLTRVEGVAAATGPDVCRLACAECKRPVCTGAKTLKGVGA